MKNFISFTLLLCLGVVAAVLPARGKDIIEGDTIRKTLQLPRTADGRRIITDIVNGSIRVSGYDGDEVRVVAYRRIRAENRTRLERARAEVTLEIRADGDRALIYEDAPWRGRDNGWDDDWDDESDDDRDNRRGRRSNHHGWDYDGYEVEFDLEIQVPSTIDFLLKTVNGDNIRVTDLTGDFRVSNVNGGIDLRSVAGSGTVSTINGDINVTFTKNPGTRTSFKTINGEIDVKFPSAPSADIRLKTMNGEIYTDFDVKGVPSPSSVREKRGGRKVYRNGDGFTVRSGDGGTEMSFSTLNGDIYLSLK